MVTYKYIIILMFRGLGLITKCACAFVGVVHLCEVGRLAATGHLRYLLRCRCLIQWNLEIHLSVFFIVEILLIYVGHINKSILV